MKQRNCNFLLLIVILLMPIMVSAQGYPTVDILSYQTEVTSANYHLKACIKSLSKVQNVVVTLNGSEVFNSGNTVDYGVNPVQNDGCDYSIDRTIFLQAGRNVIKISAKNSTGTKTEDLEVNYHNNNVTNNNIPEITFLSTATNVTSSNYNLQVCIKSSSRLTNVALYNNGSQVFTENGVNPVRNDGCDYSINKYITLQNGRNAIKVSATNYTGTNSGEIVVYCTPNNNIVINNNNNNNNNNNRRRRFNSPDPLYPIVGLSFGYVAKQWEQRENGGRYKYGFWDDQKFISGGQIGLRIEPLFKFGFGICTGVFYEYYYTQQKDGSDKMVFQEHSAYVPAHLEYRFHISDRFSLLVYGGAGMDCGIYASLSEEDPNGNEYGRNDDIYSKENEWSRFNYSFEYGGGIRIGIVQFNFGVSKGILDMSEHSNYSLKQNKNINASMSIMF